MKNKHPKNKYPLPIRTVLYEHKKNLQPIPEVGKKYHCFDDGKITFSRHFIIQVDEVLGYMAFKKKYPEEFRHYCATAKEHYWLYSRSTDKFIVTYKGEDDKFGVYVRTKQGGWFGIDDYYNSAELDVTGELWNNLLANINHFTYSKEEQERIIKENII